MEIFDIILKDGTIIGKAPREEVHGNPELIHRAVHCLIFNQKGDLFLQKRSILKDIQPNKWDTSVGGHVDQGETPTEAVKREIKEEVGLNSCIVEKLYEYLHSNLVETELVTTFKTFSEGPFVLNENEISEGRFWSPIEIENHLGEEIFTPNFEDEWKRYKETKK